MLLLTPLPYRACQLCSNGQGPADDRQCRCPAVAAPARSVPVDQARRPHGPCGPEATHLDFPGLRA